MKFYLLIIWLLLFSSSCAPSGSKSASSSNDNKPANNSHEIDKNLPTDRKNNVTGTSGIHKPKFITPLPPPYAPDSKNITNNKTALNPSLSLKERKLLINGELPSRDQLEGLSAKEQVTLQRLDRQNSIEKVFNRTFNSSPLYRGKSKF